MLKTPPGRSSTSRSNTKKIQLAKAGVRNRRTTDWFFESLDSRIEWLTSYLVELKKLRMNGGLLSAPAGDPVAMLVNPIPFASAHFAVFPVTLVEPLIKSGTSEHGCCPKCGTPWTRVIEREETSTAVNTEMNRKKENAGYGVRRPPQPEQPGAFYSGKCKGWQPGCDCSVDQDLVPCRALDPFGGSGTVLEVARQLGRDGTVIDIQPQYKDLGKKRANLDIPDITSF